MDWNSNDPMLNGGGVFILPERPDDGGIYTLEEDSQYTDADRETRLDVPIRPYNHREGVYGDAVRQAAPETPYGRFNADMRTPGYPPKQPGFPHREYFTGRAPLQGPDPRLPLDDPGAYETPFFHTSRRGQSRIFAMSAPERPSREDPGTQPDYSQLAYPADAHSGQRPSARKPWPIIPVYRRDDYMGINNTGGGGGLPRPGGCSDTMTGQGQTESFTTGGSAAAGAQKAGGPCPPELPGWVFQWIVLLLLIVIIAMMIQLIRLSRASKKRLKKLQRLVVECFAEQASTATAAAAAQ